MGWIEKLMVRLFWNKVKLHGFVLVKFPSIGESFIVIVSSISKNTFKGRFICRDDEIRSRVWEYGQYDNDIVFDLETRIPVKNHDELYCKH